MDAVLGGLANGDCPCDAPRLLKAARREDAAECKGRENREAGGLPNSADIPIAGADADPRSRSERVLLGGGQSDVEAFGKRDGEGLNGGGVEGADTNDVWLRDMIPTRLGA